MAKLSIDDLNKRFDQSQIDKMTDLKGVKYCKYQWEQIRDILVNAKAHSNLRDNVRDMFLTCCPYSDVSDVLRKVLHDDACDAALIAIAAVLEEDNVVSLDSARGKQQMVA